MLLVAVAALALGVGSVSVGAQERVTSGSVQQDRMQMPDMPRDKTIRVRVRFQTVVPLGDGGTAALARAQSHGRAMIYQMAENECAVLQATIAATCHMTGIRVRARNQARRNVPPKALNVSGTARYAITLKDS